MKHQFPLHIHISSLFLLLILVVGGLIGGVGYKLSTDMLEEATADQMKRISRETRSEFEKLIAPATTAVKVMQTEVLNESETHKERMKHIWRVFSALDSSQYLSSVYIGYESGDFFLLRRIESYPKDGPIQPPEGTKYVVQSIDRSVTPAQGFHVFLDHELYPMITVPVPTYASTYDPRTRGWYKQAMESDVEIMTSPYLFFSNKKVGATVAMRTPDRTSVVGVDLLLSTIGNNLSQQKVTPSAQLALVNSGGFVVAHEDGDKLITFSPQDGKPSLTKLENMGHPIFTKLGEFLKDHQSKEGSFQKVQLESGNWHASISPLVLKGGDPLFLVNAIPDNEMLSAAAALRNTSILMTLIILVLAIPMTWFVANSVAKPLRKLMIETEAIRHFEFSNPIDVRSNIHEVNSLASTLASMKRTIRRFLDISQAVAAEENFDKLLPMLLTETISAAGANAGVLYLVDNDLLVPAAALQSKGESLMGNLPALPTHSAGDLIGTAIRTHAPHAAALTPQDLSLAGLSTQLSTSEIAQGVAVPLLNRQQNLVGAILLLRSEPIDQAEVSFIEALSGSAASSLETRELIKSQKELFEAFIQLIANAIDAKSPYTGGHCLRVPELTKMLARAACNENDGPFKDFSLQDQDWEAVHVASWLHDCGKITTPEYVVDKATKLETIYDRIHEVRMRFEVLKRDAEIACLKAVAGGEDADTAHARLASDLAQIDDDFAFIATCNQGGEFMAADKVERLKAIGTRTWVRTLDDRMGISHEELIRKERTPAVPLPAIEAILSDKPEHVFERGVKDVMPKDNKWGFRMPVPELLYNKGELYNLAVGRGTLSEEERYKINEHIVQTAIMLSQLPFPKHLRQVPEIASGHHEKMDGTGYPKRLTKDEMSPVARMMAIADVFEALTAVDRPYKKGKTLSEAIKIMSFMKKDQHLDPELFELFLRSGVFRDYAKAFMKPEQIDEINIDQYLSAPKVA